MKISNKTYSVLIVDDDSDFRSMVSRSLLTHHLNIQTFEASSGIEAMNRINNQKFDVVMTDLEMPAMDGQALIKKIKNVKDDFAPNNILIVSQFVDSEALQNGKSGISILKKPFLSDKLHKYIEIILGAKKKKKKKKDEADQTPDIDHGEDYQSHLDVSYINPFLSAALDVIQEHTKVQATKDFVFIREENDTLGEITGLIPISCSKYEGSLAITFPEYVFIELMNNAHLDDGIIVEEISDTDKNLFKEYCSEIFEKGKESLGDSVIGLETQPIRIITGETHKIPHVVKGPILAVYFNTEFGEFIMECIVKKKKFDV